MTDKEAIEALTDKDVVNPYLTLEALEIAIDALKERAERKTGKWILKGLRGEKCVCSSCGSDDIYNLLEYRYCPHCGVKMEVDDADSN